jgi:hypothetical protein
MHRLLFLTLLLSTGLLFGALCCGRNYDCAFWGYNQFRVKGFTPNQLKNAKIEYISASQARVIDSASVNYVYPDDASLADSITRTANFYSYSGNSSSLKYSDLIIRITLPGGKVYYINSFKTINSNCGRCNGNTTYEQPTGYRINGVTKTNSYSIELD